MELFIKWNMIWQWNKVLKCTTTWMNIESIMLNERNQSQRTMWFNLHGMSRIEESIEIQSRFVVAWD
jgi:hypothetical protein